MNPFSRNSSPAIFTPTFAPTLAAKTLSSASIMAYSYVLGFFFDPGNTIDVQSTVITVKLLVLTQSCPTAKVALKVHYGRGCLVFWLGLPVSRSLSLFNSHGLYLDIISFVSLTSYKALVVIHESSASHIVDSLFPIAS
jgi:hypothetical protein